MSNLRSNSSIILSLVVYLLFTCKPIFAQNCVQKIQSALNSHGRVLNQCKLGTCWAFGIVGHIEATIYRNTGVRVELSPEYLVATYIKYQYENAKKIGRSKNFKIGVSLDNDFLLDVILNGVGLFPRSAYKPKKEYQKWSDDKLGNKISRANLKDIEKIIDEYFGEIPTEFDVSILENSIEGISRNNRKMNSSDLFELVYQKTPIIIDKDRPTEVKTVSNRNEYRSYEIKRENWGEELQFKLMEKIVENNQSILLQLFWNKSWQSGAYLGLPLVLRDARVSRFHNDISKKAHRVFIVGVRKKFGKREWKIQNSWGEKNGRNGFYWITDAYLREYWLSVSFETRFFDEYIN